MTCVRCGHAVIHHVAGICTKCACRHDAAYPAEGGA